MANAILHGNGSREPEYTQVAAPFEAHVKHLVQDPDLLNARHETNPDPRPRSGSVALRLGNATAPPFDRRFSHEGHYVGAFRKRNWLEEWTFFGDERDYRELVD